MLDRTCAVQRRVCRLVISIFYRAAGTANRVRDEFQERLWSRWRRFTRRRGGDVREQEGPRGWVRLYFRGSRRSPRDRHAGLWKLSWALKVRWGDPATKSIDGPFRL